MNLPEQLKNLLGGQSKIEQALADQAESLQSEFKAQTEKLDRIEGQLNEANSENASLKEKIQELETELETARVQIVDTEASVEKRASNKALEITAGQGVPPVATKPDNSTGNRAKTEKELWESYNQLPIGQDRNDFFKKHEAILDPFRNN